ncbi:hypothetical protein AHF37_05021 [Paragonimus kellicotti]|nr:hypothetical protein AHF37_05021 [Paragonimus kellicotti]
MPWLQKIDRNSNITLSIEPLQVERAVEAVRLYVQKALVTTITYRMDL